MHYFLCLKIHLFRLGTFTGGLNFSPSTVFMMRAVLPGEKAYSIALIGGKILRVFKEMSDIRCHKPGRLFLESYTKIRGFVRTA